jgi:hypothetical protein
MDIVLTIQEAGAGRYDAHVDGRYLLTSGQPLLDGARALLAQGCKPSDMLMMVRPPSTNWAMRAPLAMAAKLTIETNGIGRPVYRRWHGQADGGNASPVSVTPVTGITLASSL